MMVVLGVGRASVELPDIVPTCSSPDGGSGVRHELVDGMAALAAPLHLTPKHPAAPAGWAQLWRRAHSLEGGLVESGARQNAGVL